MTTPSPDTTELQRACAAVSQSVHSVLDWVRDAENAERLENAPPNLDRDLRRVARRVQRLERATKHNAAISVYGPSQAGKSFLVSQLGRPQNGVLRAAYTGTGNDFNYLKQINPEGEGESTGLVTRFTMQRPTTPQGFPIPMHLLTEADVIMILINSFYEDGDVSESPPNSDGTLAEHIAGARARMGGPVPGLQEEDLWDIADYVRRRFGQFSYSRDLEGFWEPAGDIAPCLDLGARGAFLSILWGRYPEFTDLYLALAAALALLNHDRTIYAERDALLPKEDSIIDVAMLHQLCALDDAGKIRVATARGRPVDIPKPVLSALTAELVFPIQDLPHAFLSHTDLLDFPGARNRFKEPLSVKFTEEVSPLGELFLRGKVAYLFDKYIEDQDITAMLLCIPGSNMETTMLPGLIDQWIAETMGSDPGARARRDNLLMFILTKFDQQLTDSGASGDADSSRFERRLKYSLLERFGRGRDKWVTDWGPGQPFKNCYLARNPAYPAHGYYNYTEDGLETLRPEMAGRVAELRAGFTGAEAVQRHVADPDGTWDSALTANDGGISHIVDGINRICQPDTKPRQIHHQLADQVKRLLTLVERYYVSTDMEARRSEKQKEIDALIENLEDVLESDHFGALIHALCVSQDQLREQIASLAPDVRVAAGAASPGAGDTADRPRRGRWKARRAQPAKDAPASLAKKNPTRRMPAEVIIARKALGIWMETLDIARDRVGPDLGIEPEHARVLIGELRTASSRVRLQQLLAARIRDMEFVTTTEQQAPEAALICAQEINRFIHDLGTGMLPLDERPTYETDGGARVTVFAPRIQVDDVVSLPDTAVDYAARYWWDWVNALYDMAMRNVMQDADGTVNTEQNQRLGGYLQQAREAVA
ncbi:MAG: hypothetical protein GDA36_07510 [Rhodobacteraceae bacterium]|nr:hypothetical protein [Paracoccaceae bacterium]